MSFVWAVAVVLVFAFTIERLELPARGREVATRAADSLEVLRDPALSDDAKERALRRQAVDLFRLLGILVGGSVLALGLPLGGVWVLEQVGAASFASVIDVLERVDFLAGTFVVGILGYLAVRYGRRA